jgi:predicted small lipoprotein YifL
MSRVATVITKIMNSVAGVGTIGPLPLPPSPTYPDVRVEELFNYEVQSLSGPSGLQRAVVQVNVFDKDYSRAWGLRESIKKALVDASSVQFVQDGELYDGLRELHQCIARVMVWGESSLA